MAKLVKVWRLSWQRCGGSVGRKCGGSVGFEVWWLSWFGGVVDQLVWRSGGSVGGGLVAQLVRVLVTQMV